MNIVRVAVASFIVVAVTFGVARPVHAEAISELHILPDGSLTSKAVVVTQKAGSNLFCRVAWGNTFIRLTILLHDDTEVTKKFGGKATANDIREGDMLEVSGLLSDGTGNLIVAAKKIKDLTLTTEAKQMTGTVTGVDFQAAVVKVSVKGSGVIKMALSASATIQKGKRTISLGEIAPGDKVLTASGTYDYLTQTLNVTSMEVYQDKKIFAPRSFTGKITSISATTLPTTLVMAFGAKTYTVYLSETTKILSKSKAATQLSRVAVGDDATVLGSIKEENLNEILATQVRDLAF